MIDDELDNAGPLARAVRTAAGLIAGLLLALSSTASADDIDVYISTNASSTGIPLVMFTLDFRPNVLSSQVCQGTECDFLLTDGYLAETPTSYFQLLVAALEYVFDQVRADIAEQLLIDGTAALFKVGFMITHDDGEGSSCAGPQVGASKCTNGAYVLSAFKWIDDNPNTAADESGELQEFLDKLKALPVDIQGAASHEYQGTEMFFEYYRYLTGGQIYNGHNGWGDYGTDEDWNIDDPQDLEPTNAAEQAWDTDAERQTGNNLYVGALDDAGQCSSAYTVNFSFAVSNQDTDSHAAIAADKASGGLGYTPSSNKSFAEIIERLHDADLADGTYGDQQDLPGLQNVTSYFFVKGTNQGVLDRANEWANAGGTGTATSLDDDPSALVDVLRNLFNEILSVSTTFVAPSVPANVFNRSEILGEVFIALFEPDFTLAPFWVGNVKKLVTREIQEAVEDEFGNPVLDGDGNPLFDSRTILVDANNATATNPVQAVNPLDGRIRQEAVTFWTDTAFLPAPPPEDDPDYNDGTDGREVSRGGSGQKIPGFIPDNDPGVDNATGPRGVYTDPLVMSNGTATSLVDLDAGSALAISLLSNDNDIFESVMDCTLCTYLGSAATLQSEAEAKMINLLKFTRGYDVPFDALTYTDPDGRFWWHADPLHSRPLAINYGNVGAHSGDSTPPDIRIVVSGNDGSLKMIKNKDADGTESGVESWMFIPREFLPLQKRLMEGQQGVYNPGFVSNIPGGHDPLHPYAMDGSASALVIDNNLDGNIDTADDDKVYIFIGQRRGGTKYYALDVSDPDSPQLIWVIDKDDPNLGEFAQTWSSMTPALIGVEDTPGTTVVSPGLIVTGGYNGDDGGDGVGDLGKDSRILNSNAGTEIVGTDDFEGNSVFILDARDGSLIWKAAGPASTTDTASGWDSLTDTYKNPEFRDSAPSGVTAFDSDGDGITDRFYFGDTGGNVWRGDIPLGARADWQLTKVLEIGRHFQSDNVNDRRFFARPDIVRAQQETGDAESPLQPFDAVVISSGDRAHPLGLDVENWMYMFKDFNVTSGVPPGSAVTHDQLQDLTDNCLQDGDNTDCTGVVNGILPALRDYGWKVQLQTCEDLSLSNACGEKGLARPLVVGGVAFLTTYIPPDPDSPTSNCAPKEGTGLFYAMSLFDATAQIDFNTSNNTGSEIVYERKDKLASPGIPPEAVLLSPNLLLRPDLTPMEIPGIENAKTFWYEASKK